MSKSTTQTDLKSMEAALQALRPGTDVTVEGNLTVRVTGVQVRNIIRFAKQVGIALPSVMTTMARIKLSGGDKSEMVTALLPVVASDLAELINECVQPVGVLMILEPDQAANVIATWLTMNVLDEGKVQRWKDAFAPIKDQFERLLPEKEKAGKQTSETSAKS